MWARVQDCRGHRPSSWLLTPADAQAAGLSEAQLWPVESWSITTSIQAPI